VTVELPNPVDDGRCIGCGPESRLGLRMRFDVNEDRSVESRVTVGPDFQGWRDVVHGGVVALLLDEAMAYAAGANGIVGVTADLTDRFDAVALVRVASASLGGAGGGGRRDMAQAGGPNGGAAAAALTAVTEAVRAAA